MGLFLSIQPNTKYPLGKANIAINSPSRSRPPKQFDQYFNQSKIQVQDIEATGVMEVDHPSPQHQDILHLIQALTISLSKKDLQQFIVV